MPQITLVPFEARRHLSTLERWLRSPHVERWWGDPGQALTAALDESDRVQHAVILADGLAVGYLRWQRPTRQELDAAGLTEIPDDAIDIDILIGETDHIGRGIGPKALALLLDRLARDPTISLVGLGTSTANRAAIRAFEKAGFRKHRRFTDAEYGECWLMLRDLEAVRQ